MSLIDRFRAEGICFTIVVAVFTYMFLNKKMVIQCAITKSLDIEKDANFHY